MFGKNKIDYSYKAKYMGGHSAYPKPMDVSIIVNPEFLEIPEFPARIAYSAISSVQSVGKDKLSAMRLLFVGILAFAWKKKQTFMVLTYKDEIGMTQNPVFDIAKGKVNEVQPVIYQHMMSNAQRR